MLVSAHVSAFLDDSLLNENAHSALIGFVQSFGDILDRQFVIQKEVTDRHLSFDGSRQLG